MGKRKKQKVHVATESSGFVPIKVCPAQEFLEDEYGTGSYPSISLTESYWFEV